LNSNIETVCKPPYKFYMKGTECLDKPPNGAIADCDPLKN